MIKTNLRHLLRLPPHLRRLHPTPVTGGAAVRVEAEAVEGKRKIMEKKQRVTIMITIIFLTIRVLMG